MIPQSFIQELLSRVDVVDIVGRHVKLRKSGANLLGLCPFHGEKSPSFTVSATKQFYHCFGCGAHGTAISFLMAHAGMSYVDAIHELARGLGLTVPDDARGRDQEAGRDPGLFEVLAQAERYYRHRLKDSPRAIDYLKARGLDGETAARFGIGYAPDAWRGLQAAVPDYAAPALQQAGLVVDNEGADGSRRRYDRFRDRVMFPIRDTRGRVIGFGGRVIGVGEPKYLNSPETPLFSKGRELYGLYEAGAALRAANCAIVVEGYMDVVMLAQHGIGNAVATLGTATTADHVRKLLRVVDRVVFSFDGDAAGRKAAWRALEACLPHAADTKRLEFLFLPQGQDPDSFVRQQGVDGFERLLGAAQPLSQYLIGELSSRVDLTEPEGRARFTATASPLLRALPPAALRMQLVHRVAEVGGVTPVEVERLLVDPASAVAQGEGRAGADPSSRRRRSPGSGGPRRESPGWPGPGLVPPDLVRRVRLLTALHPSLALEPFDPSFLSPDLLDWFERLRDQPEGSSLAVICEALREESPGLAAQLSEDAAADRSLVVEMRREEALLELQGALAQIRQRSIRDEIDSIVTRGLSAPGDRVRYQLLIDMKKKSG